MKIYTLSEIGAFHTCHNEDTLIVNHIGNDKLLLAVMDGCSMGTESHFASTLIAKILKRIAKECYYKAFIKETGRTTAEQVEDILRSLFCMLITIQQQLGLEKEELLSTLVLGVLDTKENIAEIITIGDGLICCNGVLTEYDQENQPDYLGYHLQEGFTNWFYKQEQRLSLSDIQNLSISTDGIYTFKPFDLKQYPPLSEDSLISSLLIDRTYSDQENMLRKKLLQIEQEFGLQPSDDLSIVRVVW